MKNLTRIIFKTLLGSQFMLGCLLAAISITPFLSKAGNAPVITTQPQGGTLVVWTNMSFSVSVSGTLPIGYQWFKNGIQITNAISSSYQIQRVQITDAGSYSVILSNSFGFATSSIASFLLPLGVTTSSDGPWAQEQIIMTNTPEAPLMVRSGDIDNLGFGWTNNNGGNINPFTGTKTPVHAFPWNPAPTDPSGTDRIMVPTSYDGNPPNGSDGYTQSTSRPGNLPQAIILAYNIPELGSLTVTSAVFQAFLDDFQAPVWGTSFQVLINSNRAPFMETVINKLKQTGPIGQMVTIPIPAQFFPSISSGQITIYIDDPVTGAGDGFAVDFVKLLINPGTLSQSSTLTGIVTNTLNGSPIVGATVAAGGLTSTTTIGSGRYALTNVPAGLVTVLASSPGYQTVSIGINSTNNQLITNNFGLSLGAPAILTEPQSQTNFCPCSIVLTNSAIGAASLFYQWRFNGTNIVNATNSSLILNNLNPGNSGNYQVIVTNGFGSVTSTIASLTLLRSTPVVRWTPLSPIGYGTPLGSGQLDATAVIPGVFSYNLPSGIVLNAGTTTLTVVFTPNDLTNYAMATNFVSLVVSPQILTVSASNATRLYGESNPVFSGSLSGIKNGDNLSALYQCNAVSNTPPGIYPIVAVVVDPGNRLANYLLSSFNGTLTIQFPAIDLSSTNLSATNIAGGLITAGRNFGAAWTVQNLSTNPISAIWTDLLTLSNASAQIVLSNYTGLHGAYAGGSYQEFYFGPVPHVAAGYYTLIAQADASNAVPELNKTNNVQTQLILITNVSPVVSLWTPTNQILKESCVSVSFNLLAQALPGSYAITNVVFYDSTTNNIIGHATNVIPHSTNSEYRTVSLALGVGLHSIGAEAIDNFGLNGISSNLASITIRYPTNLNALRGDLATNGDFVGCMCGTNSSYVVETATNLGIGSIWQPYVTNRVNASSILSFTNHPANSHRFFRARQFP